MTTSFFHFVLLFSKKSEELLPQIKRLEGKDSQASTSLNKMNNAVPRALTLENFPEQNDRCLSSPTLTLVILCFILL